MGPIIVALLVACVWGIYPFVLKLMNHVDPMVIWFYMNVVALIISAVVCWATRKNMALTNSRDLSYILTTGIIAGISSFVYIYLLTRTQYATTSIVALTFTSPLFAAVLGHYMFGENLTSQKLLGVCVIVIGIFILVWKS